MTDKVLRKMEREGLFSTGHAELPPVGQMVPMPKDGYAIIFHDHFSCGLCFPYTNFVRDVLVAFGLYFHHLTPNGVLTLSKFYWACKSYGASPDVDTFCSYYELQKQPKKIKIDGVEMVAQYGSYAFMVRRQRSGAPRLEISYCQKNKWDREW